MARDGGERGGRNRARGMAGAALGALLATAAAGASERNGGEVELWSGQATYRIPLLMPVVTGAPLGPLALEYRSGTGKGVVGWVGLGWRLEGLSSIERETRRGVPYDYARGPVCGGTYCYRDRFVLDGQDLYCDDPGCRSPRHRTGSDDGRLIRFEGESWTVQDREGTVRTYGAAPDSRIKNPKNGQVFAWLLSWSVDTHGNWARYSYMQPAGEGVAYLTAIEHAQAGSAANRELRFLLDAERPRPDRSIDYRGGFRREVSRRLESIEVRASGELIARYSLAYSQDPDSGRSLLESVRRLGPDGSARPPHVFEYTRSARAFEPQASVWTDLPGCGDSRCSLEGASLRFWPARESNLIDLDRDGLLDVHRLPYPNEVSPDTTLGPTEAQLHSGRSIRSRSAIWSVRGVPFALPTAQIPGKCSNGDCDAGFRLMDLTGDGYPDGAFYGTPASGLVEDLLLGGPGGFREPPVAWPRLSFDDNWNTFPSFGVDKHYESELRAIDMTGDGLPDWIDAGDGTQDRASVPEAGRWRVLLNDGLSADGRRLRVGERVIEWNRPRSEPVARAEDSSTADRFVMMDLLDVNGDGLPDRIQTSQQPGVAFEVAYGFGAGFDPLEPFGARPARHVLPSALFLGQLSVKSVDCTYETLLDLNGDGLLDYVSGGSVFTPAIYTGPGRPTAPFWLVAFGTGSGLSTETAVWHAPPLYEAACLRTDLGAAGRTGELADLSGDGLLDKVNGRMDQVLLGAGELPGLLARARTAAGGEIEFHYAGSAQLLDRYERPANPGLGPTRPLVVQSERRSGRPGDPAIVDAFHYARGVHDFGEREFRGFGRVTRSALDAAGAVAHETITEFATDRACAGRTVLTVVRRPGEIALARSSHTYRRITPAGEPGGGDGRWGACLLEISRESAPEGTLRERTRKTVRVYSEDPVASHYNVMRIEEWGEVDASAERDVGDDERFTHYEYALPGDPGRHLVSMPSTVRVTDAAGAPVTATRFFYDGGLFGVVGSRGLLARREDLLFAPGEPPEQGRWIAQHFTHDRAGNLIERRGPRARDDANGLVSTISYDEELQALPTRRSEGADTARPLVTELRYRGCGEVPDAPPGLALPCEIRVPGSAPQRLAYDGLGRLIERRMPGGLLERFSRQDPGPEHPGESVETTERSAPSVGLVARWIAWRDGFGRITREEAPGAGAGRVQLRRSYDARGRLLEETPPHRAGDPEPAGTRRILYDPLDRPLEIAEEDGETLHRFHYEPRAEIAETYQGAPSPERRLASEVRHRDGRERTVRIDRFLDPTRPDPRLARPISITASYDVLDRMIRLSDAMGTDPAWCHRAGIDPERTCAQRHHTEIAYDSLGRRVRLDDPDAGVTRFEYDDAGNPLRRIDADGRSVALGYDAFGRPTRIDVTPDGEGAFDATLVWERDPNRPDFGRLVGVTSEGTSYTFSYDAAGNLARRLQTTLGVSFDQRFDHDELGRLRSRTFPDGEIYLYRYAGLALSRIEGPGTPARVVLASADYDARGRPLRLVLGAAPQTPVELERSYHPQSGRLVRMRARTPFLEAFRTELEYDSLLRLRAQDGFDASHPLRLFDYDGLGRLVSAAGPWELPQGRAGAVGWSYEYDALGNLRARRSSSGGPETRLAYDHQVKPRFATAFQGPAGSERIEPDPAGRVSRVEGAALHWNAQGRLLHGARAHTLAFRDFEGARSASLSPGSALIEVGDDFDYRLQTGQANKRFRLGRTWLATRATFYAAPRQDGTSVAVSPRSGPQPQGTHAEPMLVYATDALGSLRAVIDAQGRVVETRDYTPHGESIAHTGAFELRHRFAGAPYDAGERLYELGARPYDARWGRFLAPDELLSFERAEGTHRYAYAANQPTSRVDPSGRSWTLPEYQAPATVMIPVPGALLLIDLHLPVPPDLAASGSAPTPLHALTSLFPEGYGAEIRLGSLQLRTGQTTEAQGFLTYTFVLGGGFGVTVGPEAPPGFRAARKAFDGAAAVLVFGGTAELDLNAGSATAEVALGAGMLLILPADGSPAIAVPYRGTTATVGAGSVGAGAELGTGVVLGGYRLAGP